MAYYVYKTTASLESLRYYDREKVKLAGGGLIKSASSNYYCNKIDCGWVLSGEDLLLSGGYTVDGHRLVIDTAPARSTLSLFEVKHIVGYTYEEWTTVLFLMEQLFVDYDCNGPKDAYEKDFLDTKCERCNVRTVLYLQGGHSGGQWNWGGNNRTTAALLWDSAWDFFIESAKRLEG